MKTRIINSRTIIKLASIIALTLFQCREAQAFSFNDPQGPTFTSDQMAAQLTSGSNLKNAIISAYNSGAASYTVPPGDYRYNWSSSAFALEFSNLKRTSANPFTIDATSATLWFNMNDAEGGGSCIRFLNCSNVVFNGAIIDRATRGIIEGAITQIDTANHRIEILPSPGIIVPTTFSSTNRILPFKSDGRNCAPLYGLTSASGTFSLIYTSITPSSNGCYWVNMVDSHLTDTVTNPAWINAYGDLGTLTVGDGICCLYSYQCTIKLENCDHVTISNVSNYMAKGFLYEYGGPGCNTWKDCYFGPRPGTCQWKGSDGYMVVDTGTGPTIDNVTMLNTGDDMIGFGADTSTVTTVNGNNVTFNKETIPAVVGDNLNFYNPSTGVLLGTASVTAIVSGSTVTLNQSATAFANATVEWLNHENANWTIKNCNWHDCYQSLILQGQGTLTSCTFTRLGSCITLQGLARNINITNNTFTDVFPAPNGYNIRGWKSKNIPNPSGIVITSNTFNNSSSQTINLRDFDGVTINNNTFVDPLYYTASYIPGTVGQPIWLANGDNVSITGNSVVSANNDIVNGTNSGSWIVDWDTASSNDTIDNNITCMSTPPNPGLYGIYNPPTVNAGGDGINYYSNSSVPVGQTFTTGSATNGYNLTSVSILTGTSASSSPVPYGAYTLRLYSISGTTATLMKTGTASMGLVSNGDWIQWNIAPTALDPNTTYAFTLSYTKGYINYITTGSNAYTGGEIVKIPAAGGSVTYGNTHNMDAAFHLGLAPQTPPDCTCMAALPTPGVYDINNPPTTHAGGDGINYYSNNSVPVGQTFTTGTSTNGYAMSSISILTGTSASSSPIPNGTYTLRIYSVSGTTATLLGTMADPMALTANGYWIQWNFSPIFLRPNTTYAFTLSSGGGYINYITTGGNVYTGGEIVAIPKTGGTITFGNTHKMDAAFRVGLAPQ